MSCRHSLANGTCSVCYPATGTCVPDGPGDSLDGPGAVPASPEEVIARLSARIEELEADAASSARAAKQSILDLTERCANLRARVSLHETPPVVPQGWEVVQYEDGWQLVTNDSVVGLWHPVHTRGEASVHYYVPTEALRGFLYAIRTGKRPLHAGDKP